MADHIFCYVDCYTGPEIKISDNMENNFDSKGFQELKKTDNVKKIDKPLLIYELELKINYAKQKIDINNKENEHLIKEIKELKIKLAELKGEI